MSTRFKIESLFKDLLDCHARTKDIRRQIKEELDLYDKGRIESLKSWLENNGKFWCGVCDSVFPLKEQKLLYYKNCKSDERFEHHWHPISSELIWACNSCCNKFCNKLVAVDESGLRAKRYYLAESRDKEYFFYHEDRSIQPPNAKPDRHGVVQFVRTPVWEGVSAETKIKLLPVQISIKLAEVAGLLPNIEFKEAGMPVHLGSYEWFLEDHLILNGKEVTEGR
jgi:hypothetical protein